MAGCATVASGIALRKRTGERPVCSLNTVLKKLLLGKPVCNAI